MKAALCGNSAAEKREGAYDLDVTPQCDVAWSMLTLKGRRPQFGGYRFPGSSVWSRLTMVGGVPRPARRGGYADTMDYLLTGADVRCDPSCCCLKVRAHNCRRFPYMPPKVAREGKLRFAALCRHDDHFSRGVVEAFEGLPGLRPAMGRADAVCVDMARCVSDMGQPVAGLAFSD